MECRSKLVSRIGQLVDDAGEFEPTSGPTVDKHDRDSIDTVRALVDKVHLSAPIDRSSKVRKAVLKLDEGLKVVVNPLVNERLGKWQVGLEVKFHGLTRIVGKKSGIGQASVAQAIAQVLDLVIGVDDLERLWRRDGWNTGRHLEHQTDGCGLLGDGGQQERSTMSSANPIYATQRSERCKPHGSFVF